MSKNRLESNLQIIFNSEDLSQEQKAAFICNLSMLNFQRQRYVDLDISDEHEFFINTAIYSAGFHQMFEYKEYESHFFKSIRELYIVFDKMTDTQKMYFVMLCELFEDYCNKIGDATKILKSTISENYNDFGINSQMESLVLKKFRDSL